VYLSREQALARTLEEDNARLSKRAAELEESNAAAAAAAATASADGAGSPGEDGEDGWEVVGEGERDRARLEEVRAFSGRTLSQVYMYFLDFMDPFDRRLPKRSTFYLAPTPT